MLNRLLSIFFLSFLFVTYSCQKNNKKQDNLMNNTQVINETRLIDGITIDNTIFQKNDIDLKKYQYNNQYIEDIEIKDLLDKNYRTEFIKFLKETKTEDDEFKSTLVSQLLIIRMIQLSDVNAFYILSELSKDNDVAYNGVELYGEKLTKFFIENPLFFIQQGAKYHETTLLNSIFPQLDEFFVKQSFFKDNLGDIDLKNGQLFLFPDKEKEFSESFKRKISKFSTEECIFSPSLYTAWQNKTINFIDISPLFGEELLIKLNVFERNYFNQNIQNTLKGYIINSEKTDSQSSAIIIDPDGYTNLRKDKNTSSEILQKVKSGEHIEVLDNTGDWFLVKTKEGKEGYIHKSRIKSK
ncbi:SH3 domain-containing protein [Chryseobacterium artocarpi]|uniref:SH3 domain-containing protein n=1 Tax=Chryseobacterium artocarpi TaxID=1414727 RepID=UPI0009F17790|nr:SH3 domain-containing protein [Chryseobacterium artocarpi]